MSVTGLPYLLAAFIGAISGHPNHSSTPQGAALAALSGDAVVVRTNIALPYATVLTRGGILEGSKVQNPILVEHFSFGWQALEILNFRCRFTNHHADASLMEGMPAFEPDLPPAACGTAEDFGPKAEIEAVRLEMSGPLIPAVRVAGNYAVGDWYGGGGGVTVFKRTGSDWKQIAGGGGALDFSGLRALGIPEKDACILTASPKCPPAARQFVP